MHDQTVDTILDLITSPGAEPTAPLRALAHEIARTMRADTVSIWLDRPLPAFADEPPRALIRAGRAEELRQVLATFNKGIAG
jgi:hypothetical protein